MRSLRPNRVLLASANFVSTNLGQQFVEPPAFDVALTFKQSTSRIPLIFILSPGVDPTAVVFQLAKTLGINVENCALGQGQAPGAKKILDDGLAQGN